MAEVKRNPEDLDFGSGITIDDQFKIKCSIVNKKTDQKITDFFDVETFNYLKIDEVCGCRLPMISLSFFAVTTGVFKFLNQGNILRVYVTTLKKSTDGSEESVEEEGILQDFSMLEPSVETSGNIKNVTITGIMDKIDFIYKRNNEIFKNKTSREVFEEIAGRYFELDFPEVKDNEDPNSIQPNDRQNWIRVGTEVNFLKEDVYLHTNYENSFPVVGITCSGKFRYRNFLKYVTEGEPGYKYRFVSSFQDKTEYDGDIVEIVHAGDVVDVSNAFLLNIWRGNGVIIPVYDMDISIVPIPYESKVQMGLITGETYSNINFDMSPTPLPPAFQSDNVYPEYYASKTRNISGFSMYSSQKIRFSFDKSYVPIEVLDLIMMVNETTMKGDEFDPNVATDSSEDLKEDKGEVDMISSGRYMVSRVLRHFSIGSVKTIIECCREFHPNQVGNLLGFIEDEEEEGEEE